MSMIEKVAHLADIHIRKVPTRHEEYENVFENLYKSLRKQKPDRIVIVGDLVHNYLALESEQIVVAGSFLNKLAEIAPVKITRGNHDFRKKNSKRVDSVAALVKNINNPDIEYYNKTGFYVDDNIMWAVWHHGQNNNNPWKTKEGKKILALKSETDFTTIDLFHDPVNGCKSVTGFDMNKKSYYKLSDFKGDLSMFGDIHKLQYLDKNQKKWYCSSLISQDFGEGDENFHGYLLWDIEQQIATPIPVPNEHSFKNIKLTPFTDFDDLDYEIENPTKHMRVRIVWSTLPSARNKENERKIIDYVKTTYPQVILSHKNEFVEDDTIDVDEDITIEDITSQEVQHEIFTKYLDKIGVSEQMIEDIVALDDEITQKIEIDEVTNIEWNVIKFGGKNFMSYEKIDVDWRDDDGLYQITGINTAGKTTVLKLITYLLFSKTLETESRMKHGDLRFVNNKTGIDYCDAYLVLEANGEFYGIKRRTDIERKKDGEIKAAPTKVFYYTLANPGDEMTDDNCIDALTEDNKNATQKKIDQIVGSYDNFMRVVMTTSDTLNRILSNDMATFIDSLLFDSGLDIFDKKLTGIKEHQKEINKKSQITCNVEATKTENEKLLENEGVLEEEVEDLETNKLPELRNKISVGEKYVEDLTKKLFKIDPDIVNLSVEDTNDDIFTHTEEISQLEARKGVLEEAIKPLKATYDADRLEEFNTQLQEHKQSISDLKLEIKDFERKKGDEDHKIEMLNGKIHVAKQNGASRKETIIETQNSKNCPACGQVIDKQEHKDHIEATIEKLKKEMYAFADEITAHQKIIDDVHKPKMAEYDTLIKGDNEAIDRKSLEMEGVLTEIGVLTNEKAEVEKRTGYQTELDQIPTKIQNEELKKSILQKKIDDFNSSQSHIIQNEKINKGITAAKERLKFLNTQETEHAETVVLRMTEILQSADKRKVNEQLIKDFEEQEYQNTIIETYKKCVHRDGIPRQMLSTYVIPKVNVELENVLSSIPFKVWLDVDDLRPKLAYYNTPTAIIDAISACGKERTFASIVLKEALNEINVKSKPTMFLLDEVMGKLDNHGSVEEFVDIIQILKEKYKKFLIIEQNHEVNPDYVIQVEITEGGISSAVIE